MNTLRAAACDYLALRRALGFKLYDAGLLLEQFIDFLQANHAEAITTALAVQWATEPRGVLPAWHARRLAVVRGFARWRHATDPLTEVPPSGLLPAHTRRATPYLYSGADIAALMAAAARLPSPLTAATMQAFIGLVFATGIRRGEALGLDDADLDPAAGILTVRRAKLDKTRRLPLHRSTVAALVDYQHRRDRLCADRATGALFVSTTGARLSATTVSCTFGDLLSQAGVQPPAPARCPHIHDARHYADGGVCALPGCFGWWRPRRWFFRLHNLGVVAVSVPGCRVSRWGGGGQPVSAKNRLSVHSTTGCRGDSHGRRRCQGCCQSCVAVLRDAGRAEGTVRRQQAVLDRFVAFLAGRGLDTASDRVCIHFIANQTGVRLGSLRESVKDRDVQAVRRPVVLMAEALAGRAVEVDRSVIAAKDGCPTRFRPLRDDYLASCRGRGNAAATVVAKDRAASRFLAYLDGVGVEDLAAPGVREMSGFFVRQRGLRRKTVAAMRSCLADFLDFLAAAGRTPRSLADRLPPQRHVRHESEPHL